MPQHDLRKRPITWKKGIALLLLVVFLLLLAGTAYATGDGTEAVGKLKDWIFNILTAVGAIVTGFGVLQLAMSFFSHDASQRSNAMLSIVGGIILIAVKPIVGLFV